MATVMPQNQESLRQKLAVAVKTIQWSYAIFWSISSTEPGVLKWSEGYYNGDIKTRKTVQAVEIKDDEDEAGFHRTEQLSRLYESLSAAAETHPQAKRPSAALSPEDLTDTEWYFLVCMSFEFTDGEGLPGRSLAKNTTVWLCDAHFADSKVFSRSLLAKSALIQTVVCFPYLEGVIEIGVTEKVFEDQNIIDQVKASIFEVPRRVLETCPPDMLDCDLVDNDLDMMLGCDQTVSASNGVPEDSFATGYRRFDNDQGEEEGEVSFFQNNSMGSSDCISQSKAALFDVRSDDDSHYQGVLSTIFRSTRRLVLGTRFRIKESGFVSWRNEDATRWKGDASQALLKKVLYGVPRMHENRSLDEADDAFSERRGSINQRFLVLSSLVPCRGKVDKASILDDAIEHLRALKKRVNELESDRHAGARKKKKSHDMVVERTSSNYKVASPDCITVGAAEQDVTVEVRCRWRENLMVQVLDAMGNLNLESHSVQSCVVDGKLCLSIESKFKGCTVATAKVITHALQRVIGNG